MALVLSYWSQLLQGALVHKQNLYLKITFQDELSQLVLSLNWTLSQKCAVSRVVLSLCSLISSSSLSLQLSVLQESPSFDWICWLLAGALQELDCEEGWCEEGERHSSRSILHRRAIPNPTAWAGAEFSSSVLQPQLGQSSDFRFTGIVSCS